MNKSAIIAFYLLVLVNTYAQNPIITLNSKPKLPPNSVIEIDGFIDDKVQISKLIEKINSKSVVSIINVDEDQLKYILTRLNSVKQIRSVELNGVTLSNQLNNSTFSVESLIISDCDYPKNSSQKIILPKSKDLFIENVTDTSLLTFLAGNNIPSNLFINDCEINDKNVFKRLEELDLQSLTVTNCNLERFPYNIAKSKNLKTLDLSHNNIWLLDTTGISKLSVFKCEGNPLSGYLKDKGKNDLAINKPNDKNSTIVHRNETNSIHFASENPSLKPASKNFNVLTQEFKINNAVSSKIVTNEKAKFDIPANCFVDENGNDVKGPIEIIIREYNDPVSIMIAGIPMNLAQNNTTDYLVSDGMFEIQAYAGAKKLEVKPGKQIDVTYPSANNLTKDNQLWDLDTNGTWNNISTTANFAGATSTPGLTKAVKRYQQLLKETQKIKDTSGYDYRFNDKWHCGQFLIDSGLITKDRPYKRVYNRMFYQKDRFHVDGQLLEDKKTVVIRLTPNSTDARRMYSSISSLRWVVTDELDKKEMKALLGHHIYCDARFIQAEDDLTLQVKDVNGIHSYSLEPFSYLNIKAAKNRSKKIMKRVEKKVTTYQAKNKPVKEFFIHTSNSQIEPRQKFKLIKPLRTDAEKKMSYNDFHNYALPRFTSNSGSSSLYYQFSLNKVGMKNIDCMRKIKSPKKILTQTIDKDTINNSYIYQPAENTLISCYGQSNKSNNVYAESNVDTYIINLCGDDMSYTKLTGNEIKNLPADETVCTSVKIKANDFNIKEMDENIERAKIKLFPNPTSGIFQLKMKNYDHFDVKIYGGSGQLLKSFLQNTNDSQFDISELTVGTYIINIEVNGLVVACDKIIKTK